MEWIIQGSKHVHVGHGLKDTVYKVPIVYKKALKSSNTTLFYIT